ncbi:MAG: T9SS type A sorting domain-containing protein [Sphingobacteriales bacterium]|nr:MAG: T9SS type A sorting domain-containing protein [Sphingobacteriales bacterium]
MPYLQSWINTITASPGGSVYILPADTLDENRIFDNRLTYKKGGYLGVMLRWKLGDSVFYRGIRRYLNDPLVAYGTALTADLQRNLEAESGQSLTEFFNDWFYGQGYPNYSATWIPMNGGAVQVTLNQTQSNASVSFFEMPVPLQFRNATRDTIVIANHTQSGQAFSFNLGFVPDTMIIDPQLWILSKTKTTQRVLTAVPNLEWNDRVQVYPNPARGSVQVSLPAGATGTYSYRLISAAGQTVAAGTLSGTGNNRRVGLESIAPGIYWIELSDRRGLLARKQVQVTR